MVQLLRGRVRRTFDLYFDLFNKVETRRFVENADLAVRGPHKDHGVRYQPTPSGPFLRLMSALRIHPGLTFVDIGSGKGRVLMLALGLDFNKVVGVDYSEELCEVARSNLKSYSSRKQPVPPWVVHCCDAADYRFPENESVIYMFNPFDALVLDKVLDQLGQSLQRTPRRAWMIYYFPRWHEVIEARGLFERIGYYKLEGCEFLVYVHVPRTISC